MISGILIPDIIKGPHIYILPWSICSFLQKVALLVVNIIRCEVFCNVQDIMVLFISPKDIHVA